MIEIRDLCFGYIQDELLFDDAQLSLDSGLWLLEGKNGSGKSTLLNILAANDEKRKKMGVGLKTVICTSQSLIYIKNDLALPNMKEVDCANYLLWLNDKTTDEPYEPIYKNLKLRFYSLGEKKLATLHMLSYLAPDVLLIDEYLNNLDQDNLDQTFLWLSKTAESGSIVIIASNEEDVKRRFSRRIQIAEKKLEKLIDSPFTKSFGV